MIGEVEFEPQNIIKNTLLLAALALEPLLKFGYKMS